MNGKNTVIELKNVCKTYQADGVEVHALKDVDLKIKKEEFIAIMGPSGSGKSTLLHMIGVLDKPTTGKIYLDGTDISKLNDSKLARLRGRKIGFVFQFFNLYPTLTARENIELPMLIIECDKNEREKKVSKLLRTVGLEMRSEHLPSQLSGGERQRVAIARALANDPPLILADEPTGNLDTKTGSEIMKFLNKLQEEEKVTIVMVTHEPGIAKYAERTVYLRDGEIVKGG
ncbi:MAG: ABC transporter ATP-binding protein [Candidatus Aenigmarchaeota archaeon]|nr:ABC transporter ATP-binding protein [Candidatus Aenigmarchaeota archaeon]